MFTKTQATVLLTAISLTSWAADVTAQDEFPVPLNSLELEDTGTLEAIQGNYLKFRDSKENVWVLEVRPQTTVAIEGEADASYLRPGMVVELTGDIDEKLAIAEPIQQIEVFSVKGRPPQGLFAPDADPDEAKPLRNPEVGKYRMRGRVNSLKDGKLIVSAGRFKIAGTLGEELKVKLTLDNAADAQFGDTMKVKAWYYDIGRPNPTAMRLGKALAEEVKITLTNPPSGKGR